MDSTTQHEDATAEACDPFAGLRAAMERVNRRLIEFERAAREEVPA